jgi:multiple sugar transport system ATP-binding protein
MRAGRIEQVGTYRELMDEPATAFVAGFLGQPPMNLFPNGLVRGERLVWENAQIALPDRVRPHVREGQALTVGVRAECAQALVGQATAPKRGLVLRGSAAAIEPDYGRSTQLVYLQSGPFFYAAKGTLDASLEVGDEIEVFFAEDTLCFFEASGSESSERRLPI